MNNGKTSGFLNEANERITRKIIGNTATSFSGVEPYGTILPFNINVFSILRFVYHYLVLFPISAWKDQGRIVWVRELLWALYSQMLLIPIGIISQFVGFLRLDGRICGTRQSIRSMCHRTASAIGQQKRLFATRGDIKVGLRQSSQSSF